MSEYQNEVESVSEEDADEQQHENAFQYFKSFIPVDIPMEEGDPNKECGAPLPCENYPFGCLDQEEQQASLSAVRCFYPCPDAQAITIDHVSDELIQMIGMGKRKRITFTEKDCSRALRRRVFCTTLTPDQQTIDILSIFAAFGSWIEDHCKKLLAELHGLKVRVSMENEYFSFKNDEVFIYGVHAATQRVTNDFEIQPVVQTILAYLHGRNKRMIRVKSGLQYQNTLQFSVRIMKFVPLAGQCYSQLPRYLAKKRSLINIQNNDERCFGYCLVAHYLY